MQDKYEQDLIDKNRKEILDEKATKKSEEMPNRKGRRFLKKMEYKNKGNSELQILRQPDKECRHCKGSGKMGTNKDGTVVLCFCITKKDYGTCDNSCDNVTQKKV